MCVNYASMIANQAKSPAHIEISSDTYLNLTDDWKLGTENGHKQNMWVDGTINWKGKIWQTKCTTWYQTLVD
jgi:hypothetical protein